MDYKMRQFSWTRDEFEYGDSSGCDTLKKCHIDFTFRWIYA